MNISKFKIVTSFIFGGGATGVADYVLGVVNETLKQANVSSRLDDIHGMLTSAMPILDWCADRIPAKWRDEFRVTVAAVKALADAIADGQLTRDEIEIVMAKVQAAYKAWTTDDTSGITVPVSAVVLLAAAFGALFVEGCMGVYVELSNEDAFAATIEYTDGEAPAPKFVKASGPKSKARISKGMVATVTSSGSASISNAVEFASVYKDAAQKSINYSMEARTFPADSETK